MSAIKAILGEVHAGTIYGTRFNVGLGTDEDIYFEDSGIRMYDSNALGVKGVIFRYGASEDFFRIGRYASATYLSIPSDKDLLRITTFHQEFSFWDTGQFQLPTMDDAPVANLVDGQVAAKTGGVWRMRVNAAWTTIQTAGGW